MLSNNDKIQDAAVTHQAYITRLGEGEANKANATIAESNEEVKAAVLLALISITGTPTASR